MAQLEKQVQKHRDAFASNLYELRIEANLSQQELADKAGVDRKTVNRIENSHFSPSLDTMVRLANVLKTPIQELVSR